MFRFLRMGIVLSLLSISTNVLALGMTSGPSTTSQYIQYRDQALKRTDPRMKPLPNSSKKANKCLQSSMGVCTLTEPENYGRLRYTNTHQKQDSLKKLGFQSEEYWSN